MYTKKLMLSKNGSAIINARIDDGCINAGLIVVVPLSPTELMFDDKYRVELPEELANQGTTSSMVDLDIKFQLI